MKALRILGISVAVLVVLLLAGITVLYVLFDGEKIKPQRPRFWVCTVQ